MKKTLRGGERLRWFVLIAAMVCAACAENVSTPPESVPSELMPLYDMAHRYRRDYEKGLELIVSGDAVAGKNVLDSATDRITVAARLCARTAGCDVGVFTQAMGTVFAERRLLTRQRPDERVEPAFLERDDSADGFSKAGLTLALFDGTGLENQIPLNGPVDAALNDWLTWNRPGLIEAFENYQYMRDSIAPIYEQAGLPEALLFAIMAKETGGKVHAYSRAGAAGPLQFMRHTARRYGLGSIDGFDMRLDPVAATKASVSYLDDQFRTFDNDIELALAAYNGGESRVRRLHRKYDDADFWDPRVYYALPRETREYVPLVLAAALLFLHPEDYGLEFPEIESGITTVELQDDISIGELTVCLGQFDNTVGWFRTLRNLNPRISPSDRLCAGSEIDMPSKLVPEYVEHCSETSSLVTRSRELHDAAYPESPEMIQYTVARGDTLAAIAARHRCWSATRLASVNGLRSPDYVLHVGQRLLVPRCG